MKEGLGHRAQGSGLKDKSIHILKNSIYKNQNSKKKIKN